MKIRIVPTATKSFAVQVVRYINSKTVVLKHIGSGKNKEEIQFLKDIANDWIEKTSGQQTLFIQKQENRNILLKRFQYLGFQYGLICEIINKIFQDLGLHKDNYPNGRMFLDLVLIRIVEPASKRSSQRLLSSLFGIHYQLTDIYRSLKSFSSFKDKIEERLISFAKKNLGFDFSFVLYDITTLYFETFTEDDFRKCGYSKDNKIGQPQILIGLIVEDNGFPLSFAVFEGNKFEGHTLIPVILEFKRKHQITNLTVVADAAMISQKNIYALKQAGLGYIVGARLANTKLEKIKEISRRLNQTDETCLRLKIDNNFLICNFSSKRYAKDKYEMEKQLNKAKQILEGKRGVKRNKFISKNKGVSYSLNDSIIQKTELLLGIKGCYTNINLPEKIIIKRYQDLWKIEEAFRISKNDLEARPIYHFKQQTITAHILICVVALAIIKWIEISTGKSAKYVIDQLKSVTDARMLNLLTGKEVVMRLKIPDEIACLLKKIAPH